jgi:dinuclear metal center YbgI/SA1388 family protein
MPKAPFPVAPILQSFERQFESKIAALSLAEKWDNVGMLLESPRAVVYEKLRILTCIDLTNDVVSEAISLRVNLIVSYHPVMFRAIHSLSFPAQASVIRCLDSGISVFVPHTAIDSVNDGMNDHLSNMFLPHESDRKPVRSDPISGAHVGRIVRLRNSLSLEEIFAIIKKHLGINTIRYSSRDDPKQTFVQSIGVCVGSGSSVLIGCEADLYLTGEMSHHDVLSCRSTNKSVILLDHSSSERPFLPELTKRLRLFDNVETAVVSEMDIEPIRSA